MKRWLHSMRHVLGNNQTRPEAGYTVMEIVIVLAVSTFILFAAMMGLQGRQEQVQFTQAVRNYEALLQNVINDVAKGYYQAGVNCSLSGGVPQFPGGTTQGGTNEDCIFLGKVIASDENGGDIITVIGRRTTNGVIGNDVTSYTGASPRALLDDSANLKLERINNSYGLEVTKIVWMSGAFTTQVADFGFMNQLTGGAVSSSGASNSVLLYGQRSPVSPLNKATTATASTLNAMVPLPEGLLICLRGGNGDRAEIRLGENNSHTTITSTLKTSAGGVCP